MKIAVIGNLPGPISINGPGGTEIFAHNLVKILKNHSSNQVFLFASGDSDYKESLLTFPSSQEIALNKNLSTTHNNNKIIAYKLSLFSKVVEMSESFDIIHNNSYETFLFFPFSSLIKKPVIHTVHNVFFSQNEFGIYAEKFLPKKDKLIFVSNDALQHSVGTYNKNFIYNGINIENYPYNENASGGIIWMSRASPKKGLETALEVSINLNLHINIITRISSKDEDKFLNKNLSIFFDKKQSFSVSINSELSERVKLLQTSKLFLFPIEWEEPFGLVMIEAMACGTPVVAFARGSVPEIIKDGVTGFIINSSDTDIRGDFIIKKTGIEGLKEAINKIYSMPEADYKKMRQNCRTHVEKNFTIERMVSDYEKLYQEIIDKNKK